MWVMKRQIDGTIPAAVMDGSTSSWDPRANTLDGGAPGALLGPVGLAQWRLGLGIF